jgi:quinol-cytochrome oxidoreductase complex cytochrome b subunit
MINDINKKIDSINENLDNIIKEINNFKENLKNNEIYSENKEKKEIKKENSKRKNKEDNNEEIHKRAFCNIKKIYELLLFISIFIIILISHLFYRIKLVENNDLLEKIKKNKIKTQYSILNAIENLTPDDMKYLQNVIDEGSSMDKLFSFEIDDTKKKNKVGNMNADKHLKENNDNIKKDENNIEKKSKINEKDEDR